MFWKLIFTGKGVRRHLVCMYGPLNICSPIIAKNKYENMISPKISPILRIEATNTYTQADYLKMLHEPSILYCIVLYCTSTISATAGRDRKLFNGLKTLNVRKTLMLGMFGANAINEVTTTMKSNQFQES